MTPEVAMERDRALFLTRDVLARLVEGQAEWPLSLVREVYIFGSVARGALQPGDVDLDVEFDRQDARWKSELLTGLSYGYDPRRVFRQALVGRKRGVQITFDNCDDEDLDLTLLWRRGDDLSTAVARLHAIQVDPEAGRAERQAMLPEFEGMDRWLPYYYRQGLIEAIDSGAIQVERLVLEDRAVDDRVALRHLADRWPPTSPLHRAARAAFTYFIDRGVDPSQVRLHGQ
ncbi:hypothetical protein [Actinoplanes sp. NPDC048796]|uniref:hypothetical protein n=1 Tax=Actinoplanes sp. NPDC048796 TaxID=3155640 RepID=UPI0033F68DA9